MAVFVRAISASVNCPTSRYVGQDGVVDGRGRAELRNEGDQAETVQWVIEVSDSDGNHNRASGYAYVAAKGAATVGEGAFFRATYTRAGSKTATCRFTVKSESSSSGCTFTIYPRESMPEDLRKAYDQESDKS
jgi:hypothetical protein